MEWRSGHLLKLLYLDDDPDDACLLKEYLHAIADPRFFVTHLKEAGQATACIACEQYDVVICDYFLRSHGDYDQTCEHFVQELVVRRPHTAVIVTTDHTDLADASTWMQQEIEAGRIGFICKGLWSPANLLAVIARTDEVCNAAAPVCLLNHDISPGQHLI